jgi:membrane-bound serine protease (ClpP class)
MLWPIILLTLLGLALLAAEVILPGMIAGAIGIALLVAAVWLSYADYGAQVGTLMLAGILTVTFSGFLVWLYLFPRTFIGKRLLLDAANPSEVPDFKDLMGKEGVALTDLRPAGTARIDNRRIDVVAESGYISAEAPIRVRKVEGIRVVVAHVKPA